MNYELFKSTIIDSVRENIGYDVEISLTKVRKNNGLVLDGLIIKEDSSNTSPTLYLNYYYDAYKKGILLESIVDNIIEVYNNGKLGKDIDISFFEDFDLVKEKLCYKLISYSKNEEMLKDVPHIKFLDFAIVFFYPFECYPVGKGSILIHNSSMYAWGVSAEQLYAESSKNTHIIQGFELLNLGELILDIIKKEKREDYIFDPECLDKRAYVLTNHSRICGAATVLYPGLLMNLYNKINDNFYLIPSSIHEFIILPASDVEDCDYLKAMIREVNETQVEAEDFLSDNLYYFDVNSEEMIIC